MLCLLQDSEKIINSPILFVMEIYNFYHSVKSLHKHVCIHCRSDSVTRCPLLQPITIICEGSRNKTYHDVLVYVSETLVILL